MNRAGSTARADALVPAAHPFSRHLRRVVAAPPHRAWTRPTGRTRPVPQPRRPTYLRKRTVDAPIARLGARSAEADSGPDRERPFRVGRRRPLRQR
jgi:hypothetical protein